MKKLNTQELMIEALGKKFPDMWTKPSEEYDGREGSIWSGEGSEYKDGEFEMFSYYSGTNSFYEMGVKKELATFLSKHNWESEFQDPGTIFFYNHNKNE